LRRVPHRIRLKPEVYHTFRLRCKRDGVRICEALEALMGAYAVHPQLLALARRLGGMALRGGAPSPGFDNRAAQRG